VTGGGRWTKPQIVRFVAHGPCIYVDPEFASSAAVHSSNLGDFSMALRKANGIVIWPLCKITKIPRIALVILPLQNICRLEFADFRRICDGSERRERTIPAIATDDLRSFQEKCTHHILGTKEQFWIYEVLIKLTTSGRRRASGLRRGNASKPTYLMVIVGLKTRRGVGKRIWQLLA